MVQITVKNGKPTVCGVAFELPEGFVFLEVQNGFGSVLCFRSPDSNVELHVGAEESEDTEEADLAYILESGTYRALQPFAPIERFGLQGLCGLFTGEEDGEIYYEERYRVRNERAHFVVGVHIDNADFLTNGKGANENTTALILSKINVILGGIERE